MSRSAIVISALAAVAGIAGPTPAAVEGIAGVAAASAQTPAPVPSSQLTGTFQMSGTVTVATSIPGERVGQQVARTWTFTPLCATGPCATVRLVRQRAIGTDTVVLRAVGANSYSGTGRFYAPLRCTGQIYRPGEAVPFKLSVTVTATQPTGAGNSASAIRASYVNSSRVNLTPCIGILGHDAARYTGQVAGA